MLVAFSLSAHLLMSSAASLEPSARAEPAASWLDLEWSAVDGCPSREAVVETALRLSQGGMPRAVRAKVRITADDRGFTAELIVNDPDGPQRRVLSSPYCDSLSDALALIVVVSSDPIALAERFVAPERELEESAIELVPPEPPQRSLRRSPAEEGSVEPLGPSPQSSEGSDRWPTLELGATIAAGLGPSQGPALGLSGGLGLVWTRARADLRGSYWLPSRAVALGRSDVGAELTLAAGAARAGPRWVWGTLSLALLGGIELGALTAEGYGFTENRTSRGLWTAGLLAPRLAWQPLRWIALGVEVEGLVAVTRRTYAAVDSDAILYTVPFGGLRIAGGITLVFP